MKEIPSVRAFVAGSSGSGKTHALRHLLLPHFPRLLLVDFVGEMERRRAELPGKIIVARSIDETRHALKRCASLGRWAVIAQLTRDEFYELVEQLVPDKFSDATPLYSRLVGGFGLVTDEADKMFSHNAPEVVFNIPRRGRHVGVSMLAASQTPASVHPLIRSQSRYLVLCQMWETNSLKYFAAALPREVMVRLEGLRKREVLIVDNDNKSALQLDESYRVVWRWTHGVAPAELVPLGSANHDAG